MQENFTRKIEMTEKNDIDTAKGVRILQDAVKKFGSIPDVQRALLVDAGVEISHTALYNALDGTSQSLKPVVITAICHLVYGGNWGMCGKALESDFLTDKLKKR